MDALILVGGGGTRLKSLVSDRPKPMALVGGRPFVEWLVLELKRQGIQRILFSTGHMSSMVEAYFGDGRAWDLNISYSVDPFPLGTGGAIRHAMDGMRGDEFLVLNGDSYCPFEIERMRVFHKQSAAQGTIWLTTVGDGSRFGAVDCSSSGEILGFREKTGLVGGGVINAGVYLLSRSLVAGLEAKKNISIERDVFPFWVGRGLYAVQGQGPFVDIGTPESYTHVLSEQDWKAFINQNVDH